MSPTSYRAAPPRGDARNVPDTMGGVNRSDAIRPPSEPAGAGGRGRGRREHPHRRRLLGQQGAQLLPLVGAEQGPAALDSAYTRQAEVGPPLLDLANLRLDRADVCRIRGQQLPQVHLGDAQVGLGPDRLLLELAPQALERLHLRGRQPELLAVAQHDADEWPRRIAGHEVLADLDAKVLELLDQLPQAAAHLLMDDGDDGASRCTVAGDRAAGRRKQDQDAPDGDPACLAHGLPSVVDFPASIAHPSPVCRGSRILPVMQFQLRKIGHVVLNVTDLERAVAFYTGVLGLEVSDRYPDSMVPGGMVFLRLNPDHHGVALVGGATKGERSSLNHFAFEGGSVDGVFRARGWVREPGVPLHFEGRRRAGCQIAIEFTDPDGNNLEIY